MEEVIQLPFHYAREVVTWAVGEAAPLVVKPGLSVETAARQLRRYGQLGFIYPAGHRGSGVSMANLYPAPALFAAAVLSVLNDVSENRTLLTEASRALYGRTAGEAPTQLPDDRGTLRTVPPVIAAAAAAIRGEDWALAATVFYSDQTGRQEVRARVFALDDYRGEAEHLEAEMQPISGVTVQLMPLLLPIATRIMDRFRTVAAH